MLRVDNEWPYEYYKWTDRYYELTDGTTSRWTNGQTSTMSGQASTTRAQTSRQMIIKNGQKSTTSTRQIIMLHIWFDYWPFHLNFRSSHRGRSVRKDVLRNFAKFTRKHLCRSLFFNKVAGLRQLFLLKERLLHRCFPVNFAKFLRKPFLQNTSGPLFLLFGPLCFIFPVYSLDSSQCVRRLNGICFYLTFLCQYSICFVIELHLS